jgi:hypothetical protein
MCLYTGSTWASPAAAEPPPGGSLGGTSSQPTAHASQQQQQQRRLNPAEYPSLSAAAAAAQAQQAASEGQGAKGVGASQQTGTARPVFPSGTSWADDERDTSGVVPVLFGAGSARGGLVHRPGPYVDKDDDVLLPPPRGMSAASTQGGAAQMTTSGDWRASGSALGSALLLAPATSASTQHAPPSGTGSTLSADTGTGAAAGSMSIASAAASWRKATPPGQPQAPPPPPPPPPPQPAQQQFTAERPPLVLSRANVGAMSPAVRASAAAVLAAASPHPGQTPAASATGDNSISSEDAVSVTAVSGVSSHGSGLGASDLASRTAHASTAPATMSQVPQKAHSSSDAVAPPPPGASSAETDLSNAALSAALDVLQPHSQLPGQSSQRAREWNTPVGVVPSSAATRAGLWTPQSSLPTPAPTSAPVQPQTRQVPPHVVVLHRPRQAPSPTLPTEAAVTGAAVSPTETSAASAGDARRKRGGRRVREADERRAVPKSAAGGSPETMSTPLDAVSAAPAAPTVQPHGGRNTAATKGAGASAKAAKEPGAKGGAQQHHGDGAAVSAPHQQSRKERGHHSGVLPPPSHAGGAPRTGAAAMQSHVGGVSNGHMLVVTAQGTSHMAHHHHHHQMVAAPMQPQQQQHSRGAHHHGHHGQGAIDGGATMMLLNQATHSAAGLLGAQTHGASPFLLAGTASTPGFAQNSHGSQWKGSRGSGGSTGGNAAAPAGAEPLLWGLPPAPRGQAAPRAQSQVAGTSSGSGGHNGHSRGASSMPSAVYGGAVAPPAGVLFGTGVQASGVTNSAVQGSTPGSSRAPLFVAPGGNPFARPFVSSGNAASTAPGGSLPGGATSTGAGGSGAAGFGVGGLFVGGSMWSHTPGSQAPGSGDGGSALFRRGASRPYGSQAGDGGAGGDGAMNAGGVAPTSWSF